MKNIVKPRHLVAFKIWIEKLGYKVKNHRSQSFTASTNDRNVKKNLRYILFINIKNGNKAAYELGKEFEQHLLHPFD